MVNWLNGHTFDHAADEDHEAALRSIVAAEFDRLAALGFDTSALAKFCFISLARVKACNKQQALTVVRYLLHAKGQAIEDPELCANLEKTIQPWPPRNARLTCDTQVDFGKTLTLRPPRSFGAA